MFKLCPGCGARNEGGLIRCSRCRSVLDTLPEAQRAAEAAQALAVARAFKGLLTAFAVYLLACMAMGAAPLALVRLLGTYCVLISMVVLPVQMYRVVSARGGPESPLVMVAGALLPCINILVLLQVSGTTTKWLRDRGVQVGLLGPSKPEMERLGREASSAL